MDKETHSTLKPKTNIIIVCVIASFFLFITSKSYPYLLVLISIILGIIGGIIQILSFKEGKEKFIEAKTTTEARKAMAATNWGKKYIYFLWVGNILLIIIAVLLKNNPILDILIAYIILMLVREIIKLKTSFIAIISILICISGMLLVGAGLIAPQGGASGSSIPVLLLGLLISMVGVGLSLKQNWARVAATILFIILAGGLIYLISTWPYSNKIDPRGEFIYMVKMNIIPIAISIIVVMYLNLKSTRMIFKNKDS